MNIIIKAFKSQQRRVHKTVQMPCKEGETVDSLIETAAEFVCNYRYTHAARNAVNSEKNQILAMEEVAVSFWFVHLSWNELR